MTVVGRRLQTESKFLVEAHLLPALRSNHGNLPFRSLKRLGTETFNEKYLDKTASKRTLSRCGIWIRHRELTPPGASQLHPGDRVHPLQPNSPLPDVEARKRIYGDHIHSVFMAYQDRREIRALIQDHMPDHPVEADDFGLGILAKFTTTREKFLVDDKFSLALEHTDFGHLAGEISLLVEDDGPARTQIDAFLSKYSWFCGGRSGQGALSTYVRLFGAGERKEAFE